jgi:hypothetical protein
MPAAAREEAGTRDLLCNHQSYHTSPKRATFPGLFSKPFLDAQSISHSVACSSNARWRLTLSLSRRPVELCYGTSLPVTEKAVHLQS